MDWAEVARGFNALGCGIALGFLFNAAHKQWSAWNRKTQQHWWALFGWVALGLEGALESLILQTEPGPRIVIQTLVVAWTLRALTIRDELRAEPTLPRREHRDG